MEIYTAIHFEDHVISTNIANGWHISLGIHGFLVLDKQWRL